MATTRSSGFAVISIVISLIVAAILMIAILSLYKGGKDADSEALETPIERASILQCRAQIRTLETSITLYRAENGAYPGNLDLLAASTGQRQCPVTGNSYHYDAETGEVGCPDHP